MFKINKSYLKEIIAKEEQYRNDELEARLNCYCLMGMAKNGATIMSLHGGEEYGKQFETELSKEKIENAIKDIKGSIKYSQWKEKFYRYTYNKDLDNMKKYNVKCSKYENQELDAVMDLGGESYMVNIDHSLNGKEPEIGTGEGGVLLIAEQFKKCFEARKELIQIVGSL